MSKNPEKDKIIEELKRLLGDTNITPDEELDEIINLLKKSDIEKPEELLNLVKKAGYRHSLIRFLELLKASKHLETYAIASAQDYEPEDFISLLKEIRENEAHAFRLMRFLIPAEDDTLTKEEIDNLLKLEGNDFIKAVSKKSIGILLTLAERIANDLQKQPPRTLEFWKDVSSLLPILGRIKDFLSKFAEIEKHEQKLEWERERQRLTAELRKEIEQMRQEYHLQLKRLKEEFDLQKMEKYAEIRLREKVYMFELQKEFTEQLEKLRIKTREELLKTRYDLIATLRSIDFERRKQLSELLHKWREAEKQKDYELKKKLRMEILEFAKKLEEELRKKEDENIPYLSVEEILKFFEEFESYRQEEEEKLRENWEAQQEQARLLREEENKEEL